MPLKTFLRRIFDLAGVLIVAGCLVYVVSQVWRSRLWELDTANFKEIAVILLIGSLVYAGNGLLLSGAWYRLLRWCGDDTTGQATCHGVYGRTQIAKYIPGNVFHFAGRQLLGARAGISQRYMAWATLLEGVGLVVAAGVTAALGLLSWIDPDRQVIVTAFAAVAAVLVILPFALNALLRRLPLARRLALPDRSLSDFTLGPTSIYLFYAVFLFVTSVILWVLVSAVAPAQSDLPFLAGAGIFALAWAGGYVTPGASAGIGVREAILILTLSGFIGEAASTLAAVALRVITLSGDGLFFVIAALFFPAPSVRRAVSPTPAPALNEATDAAPIRVVFLARSLEVGGAEMQLALLATSLDPSQFQITVLSFYPHGPLDTQLRDGGITVLSLEKGGRWDLVRFSVQLARDLRRLKPQVLQSFLGPPNVFAALVKPLLPKTRVAWNVRASDMDLGLYDYTWRITFTLERALSHRADVIIANSYAGRDHAAAQGFPAEKISVIRNGIDTDRFKPDPEVRRAVRAEWRVREDEVLVGMIARFDPIKDHRTFLRAAALLASEHSNARFVCVGDGREAYAAELKGIATSLGLTDRIIWAGARGDTPAVFNALDFHALSSTSEGFPNTIGEAMACGVPCVVTDVGDCADIVGDTGIVVPPREPQALATAWRNLIEMERDRRCELSTAARRRIQEHFSLPAVVAQYEKLYEELAKGVVRG